MEHPTRGLDIESADWVWSQLLARREHGTAIIFASADIDELLRYSDRILVFFSGACSPSSMRARPTSMRSATSSVDDQAARAGATA